MLDDPGRVNVAIHNRPAAGAVVDVVGQRLRRHSSAAVAFLGSSTRVDLCSDATGTFRLVAHERDQLAPRGIEDGLGEPAACQSGDVQVLEGNVGVTIDQIAG
jgi:NADPH-dependent curcumin reductase CurA